MATLAARTKSRFEGGTSPGEDGGGVMGGGWRGVELRN